MLSYFPHKSGPPNDESLAAALGPAEATWKAAVSILEQAAGAPGSWKSYGPTYGWRLDFRKTAGPLAGIYPQQGSVLLGINLLQKEWEPAFELPLSSTTRHVLETSTPLRDGRFILVQIAGPESLQDLAALVRLKTGISINA